MKERFELIIFDWDGTLCDSIAGIVSCIQQSAVNCMLEPPSVRQSRDVIGLSLEQAMATLFPELNSERVVALAEQYRGLYLSRPVEEDPLFEGVEELLVLLRQAGYQLAVATGKSRRGLNHALVGTGVGHYFDLTCCGDEALSKPAPDMLYTLLAKSNVKADKAVMVGDSWLDLKMANNASMASIAINSGVHSRDELTPFNPLICLDEVSYLAKVLL